MAPDIYTGCKESKKKINYTEYLKYRYSRWRIKRYSGWKIGEYLLYGKAIITTR
jgi:hypothetical protein